MISIVKGGTRKEKGVITVTLQFLVDEPWMGASKNTERSPSGRRKSGKQKKKDYHVNSY